VVFSEPPFRGLIGNSRKEKRNGIVRR